MITPIFLPKQDGTVRLIQSLANGLTLKGHSVTLITRQMRGVPSRERIGEVDVFRVPPLGSSFMNRLKFIGNASALLASLSIWEPEINIVHCFGSSALAAAIFGNFRHFRIIVTFPGVAEEILVGGDSTRALKFAGLSALKLTCFAATRITVPTLNAAKAISGKIGSPNMRKLTVIPNPMDLRIFLSKDSCYRRPGNSMEDKRFSPEILSVGNLSYRKGFDILLRSFKSVLFKSKDARLTIVGQGPRFGELMELAGELGLGDHVRFLSRLSDEELVEVYNGSDIFVLSSRPGGEAFGYAMVEAMAAKKPVITTSTPGPREIVEKSGGGLVVETMNVEALSEAIIRLAEDRRLCVTLGALAGEYVRKNFDLPSVAAKFEKMYTE